MRKCNIWYTKSVMLILQVMKLFIMTKTTYPPKTFKWLTNKLQLECLYIKDRPPVHTCVGMLPFLPPDLHWLFSQSLISVGFAILLSLLTLTFSMLYMYKINITIWYNMTTRNCYLYNQWQQQTILFKCDEKTRSANITRNNSLTVS